MASHSIWPSFNSPLMPWYAALKRSHSLCRHHQSCMAQPVSSPMLAQNVTLLIGPTNETPQELLLHPIKPSIASSTSSGDNENRTTKTMDGTGSLEIVQVEKTQSRQSNLRECLTKFSHSDSPLHLLPGSRISRKVLHRDVWLPLAT